MFNLRTLARGAALRTACTLAGYTAILALLLNAPVADAQVASIVWDAAQNFERTFTVPPGQYEEVCGSLAPPQRVKWSYESTDSLDFNIHFHEGKQVTYPARRDEARTAGGSLIISSPQEYCWMWTNKQKTAVQVRLQLSAK